MVRAQSGGSAAPAATGPVIGWAVWAAVAAVVGLGASVYLLVEYITGQPGICLTGSGCDAVRASAFAYPLGIPMPALGVAFFGVATWLILRAVDDRPLLGLAPRVALLGLTAVGGAAFVALTALEAFVIGAFCSWCLVAAAAGWLLLGAAVAAVRARRSAAAPQAGRSSRVRQQHARAVEAARAGTRRALRLSGAVTTLLVGGLLLLEALGTPAPATGEEDLAPTTSPRLGSGAVTVVEFADFQCPGCASLSPVLQQLAREDEITLVYRHFPLTTIHANAEASARAAVAAGRQDAFWPMAEALFRHQPEWESLGAAQADAYFAATAQRLGLDVDRWRADYGSAAVRAEVDADATVAAELGLRGTPTLYVDGQPYDGPLTLEGLRAAIAATDG
ncbi:MAG TPA: vitamin K epoxide reductase family protein [candidate division Zixibacteria bacterium]|nr:vitamin K epoxide reductase family protein [candidate division Zixibacteria bacterium]